ncbi:MULTISPECIES: hypothetical protein [unclassified Rhodococcus (in: high G+C Gram-positive bacteria)]|uniref:hypothetical protein n=1 Tax=unclassified Rhodococcus (in: high G+C Gram-positive bacteria) TaxID=192944 RepID=UPI0006F43A93|nr:MULTISPECIES: hypothetical protein [unclassified Rhodococcus (in: high G+C Gram-positive bacteria)]KQU32034.1 hypothetical protein ASG69_21020 [Rhodococcus sp. Leaf225]KQU41201.1 hypothetical protein ASH03_17880 [Rhodococcus sp. Leaf258]
MPPRRYLIRLDAYKELMPQSEFGRAYLYGEVHRNYVDTWNLALELGEMLQILITHAGRLFNTKQELEEAIFDSASGWGMGLHQALREHIEEHCIERVV